MFFPGSVVSAGSDCLEPSRLSIDSSRLKKLVLEGHSLFVFCLFFFIIFYIHSFIHANNIC